VDKDRHRLCGAEVSRVGAWRSALRFSLLPGLGMWKIKSNPKVCCPNCAAPIRGKGTTTPSGVVVCDRDCVQGVINGGRAKRMWDLVHSVPGICPLCPDHAAAIAAKFPALDHVAHDLRAGRSNSL